MLGALHFTVTSGVSLGSSLTTKRQVFLRYIVPTPYILLNSNWDWIKSPGYASPEGAFPPATSRSYFIRFYFHRVFVAVKTMLIVLQSEQQIITAPAFRPMTCYCFVTRVHDCCLHHWKTPSRCLENSMIVTQRSLGNPMPHLSIIHHKRIWSNFMGQIFTGCPIA